jgi:hypothetical protein
VLRNRNPVDIPCTRIICKMESPAVSYGRLRIYDIIKKNWKNKRNNKPTFSFNRNETRSTPQCAQQKIDFFYHIGYLTPLGEITTHDHAKIIQSGRI